MPTLAEIRARILSSSGPGYVRPARLTERERIAALPRRPPPLDDPTLPSVVEQLTSALKTKNGTMRLKNIQAAALWEMMCVGGLLGNIGVGQGKTLISLLIPVVANSLKSVILIPPGLLEQLLQRNYPMLQKHWRIPELKYFRGADTSRPGAYIVTHRDLSDRRYARVLDVIKPDVLAIDEAHAVAGDSARTNRLHTFAGAHPSTRYGAMSGTLFGDEPVGRAAELARLVLRNNSPFPVLKSDQLNLTEELIAAKEERREEFRRHLYFTPGVIASRPEDIGVSLVLSKYPVTLGPAGREALARLRKKWELPDGTELIEATEFGRHAKTLSQGFYYKPVWPNGVRDEEWLELRKEWNRAVRAALRRPKPGLDTPGLLEDAAIKGEWRPKEWAPWAAVKDRVKLANETVWVDDGLLQAAGEWGRTNIGIIWTRDVAVGPRLAALSGFPYYGEGGSPEDPAGIEDGSRTIIASVGAHGTGRELQMFNRGLVLRPSSSSKTFEQLLGRMHRTGQKADTVYIDICLHTPELKRTFEAAEENARFMQMSPGNENPKLLYADRTF